MPEMINFPLSSPQVQAAERVASQLQHNPSNLLQAQQAEGERVRQMRTEIVTETQNTENPNVDEEGHFGAEYHGGKKRESQEEGTDPSPAPEKSDDDDSDELQGRFINLVV